MTTSFEDRLRADLHAAAGGTSFDAAGPSPASVIILGQRVVRRRRLTYAAGAAVLAIVAVVAGSALSGSDPRRGVTPPAGSTTGSGAFGAVTEFRPGGKDADDPDASAVYTVQAVEEGGERSVVLNDVTDAAAHELTRLPLTAPESADIVFKNGLKVVLVTGEPLSVVRIGASGPTLQQVASTRVAGTTRWMTMGSAPGGFQDAWEEVSWSTENGDSGTTPVPRSVVLTVPGKSGAAGWARFPVRFTTHSSATGAIRVDVERWEPALTDLVHAGSLTLPTGQDQVFMRGDGASSGAIYGLTLGEPTSVTPRGDSAARLAGGWTSVDGQVSRGVWAIALELTGMDDSSPDPVPSISWKDAAGASHTFDLP